MSVFSDIPRIQWRLRRVCTIYQYTTVVAVNSDRQTTSSVLSLEHVRVLAVVHSLPPDHRVCMEQSFRSWPSADLTSVLFYRSPETHFSRRLQRLVTDAFSTLTINILLAYLLAYAVVWFLQIFTLRPHNLSADTGSDRTGKEMYGGKEWEVAVERRREEHE